MHNETINILTHGKYFERCYWKFTNLRVDSVDREIRDLFPSIIDSIEISWMMILIDKK